ncbi:MAG: hypothetical protein DHS20C21_04610 [Gemmatimonadota bacterium]|nr:MAG: hypothetical protein DHS20C21_04610 [Gemmatimonadota bacterium]
MNRTLGALVRLAIGVGLLVFLLVRVDLKQAWATLSATHPAWLAAAVVAQLGSKTCWLLRWRALLGAAECRVPPGALARLILVGLFFNNFLPSSVGGDVMRALGLTRYGATRATAAASVLGDRVIGILALAIMAVAGGAVGAFFWPGQGPWGVAVGFAALVVGLVVAVGRPEVFRALTGFRGLPEAVSRKMKRVLDSLSLLAERRRILLVAILFSLGLAACSAVFHWSVGRAVEIQVPLVSYFVIVPTVMLFAALPITFNGLGVRELGLVGFLGAQGVPQEEAAVFAALAFVVPLTFAVAGGVVFLAQGRSNGRREPREAMQ